MDRLIVSLTKGSLYFYRDDIRCGCTEGWEGFVLTSVAAVAIAWRCLSQQCMHAVLKMCLMTIEYQIS